MQGLASWSRGVISTWSVAESTTAAPVVSSWLNISSNAKTNLESIPNNHRSLISGARALQASGPLNIHGKSLETPVPSSERPSKLLLVYGNLLHPSSIASSRFWASRLGSTQSSVLHDWIQGYNDSRIIRGVPGLPPINSGSLWSVLNAVAASNSAVVMAIHTPLPSTRSSNVSAHHQSIDTVLKNLSSSLILPGSIGLPTAITSPSESLPTLGDSLLPSFPHASSLPLHTALFDFHPNPTTSSAHKPSLLAEAVPTEVPEALLGPHLALTAHAPGVAPDWYPGSPEARVPPLMDDESMFAKQRPWHDNKTGNRYVRHSSVLEGTPESPPPLAWNWDNGTLISPWDPLPRTAPGLGEYEARAAAEDAVMSGALAASPASELWRNFPASIMSHPQSISTDPATGTVFLSDTHGARVIAVSGWGGRNEHLQDSGKVETVIGSGLPGRTDGLFHESCLWKPAGTLWDARRGILWIADAGAGIVKGAHLASKTLFTLGGQEPLKEAASLDPVVALDTPSNWRESEEEAALKADIAARAGWMSNVVALSSWRPFGPTASPRALSMPSPDSLIVWDDDFAEGWITQLPSVEGSHDDNNAMVTSLAAPKSWLPVSKLPRLPGPLAELRDTFQALLDPHYEKGSGHLHELTSALLETSPTSVDHGWLERIRSNYGLYLGLRASEYLGRVGGLSPANTPAHYFVHPLSGYVGAWSPGSPVGWAAAEDLLSTAADIEQQGYQLGVDGIAALDAAGVELAVPDPRGGRVIRLTVAPGSHAIIGSGVWSWSPALESTDASVLANLAPAYDGGEPSYAQWRTAPRHQRGRVLTHPDGYEIDAASETLVSLELSDSALDQALAASWEPAASDRTIERLALNGVEIGGSGIDLDHEHVSEVPERAFHADWEQAMEVSGMNDSDEGSDDTARRQQEQNQLDHVVSSSVGHIARARTSPGLCEVTFHGIHAATVPVTADEESEEGSLESLLAGHSEPGESTPHWSLGQGSAVVDGTVVKVSLHVHPNQGREYSKAKKALAVPVAGLAGLGDYRSKDDRGAVAATEESLWTPIRS